MIESKITHFYHQGIIYTDQNHPQIYHQTLPIYFDGFRSPINRPSLYESEMVLKRYIKKTLFNNNQT
jgi:hypothetical protein